MGLTSQGKDFIAYLKAGRTDNPEYEQTISDVVKVIQYDEGKQPTRQSVRELLLQMEELD